MISLEQAQEIIDQHVEPLGQTVVDLDNAAGHVLSADIISPINVSPFRNSAMDGFAIVASLIDKLPVTLQVAETVFAGEDKKIKSTSHQVVKVMTGAVVSDNFDAVVKFEDTEYDDNTVTFKKQITVGQNIRLPGEDIKEGELLLKAGRKIKRLHIGLLASVGLNQVKVVRKPKVLVVATGDELIEAGQTLKPGQIYNSNSYAVKSMVAPFCSEIQSLSVADDREKLEEIFSSDADVIITSGGVSAGEKDYLPQVAAQCGWKQMLHKVSIKPGKPIFLARKNKQVLFGLPGNPLSTVVTCAVFVIPALKKMIGLKKYKLPMHNAELSESSSFKSGRTLIWPGMFENTNRGITATFSGKKSSAALSAVLGTDGLIFQNESGNSPKIKVCSWEEILQL